MRNGPETPAPRARRRVMVRFGAAKLERTAFSKNLSETGAFLRTNSVHAPGSTIQIRMELDGRPFAMWAQVVWAKKAPPRLAHVLDCGMGIRFIDPPTDWLTRFRAWRERAGGV